MARVRDFGGVGRSRRRPAVQGSPAGGTVAACGVWQGSPAAARDFGSLTAGFSTRCSWPVLSENERKLGGEEAEVVIVKAFGPGSGLEPGRKSLWSRLEPPTGMKDLPFGPGSRHEPGPKVIFGAPRRRAPKQPFGPGSTQNRDERCFWKLFFGREGHSLILFFEKCNKFINSISFDLFIRKMQLKYQIVHKNVIYLFITNSFFLRFEVNSFNYKIQRCVSFERL